MEPILTTVIAALVAGATAQLKDVASDAVKDAYQGLKGLLVHKLSDDSLAVELLEKKPASKAAQEAVAEAIAEKQLHRDTELKEHAEQLEKALAEARAAGVAGIGDIEIGRVQGYVNAIVEDLVASGRIKIDSVVAETGTAWVKGGQAGTGKK
jgi:hypothetical protein